MGGGQLGRMFAHAAQAMGYQVAVLDPARRLPGRPGRRPPAVAPATTTPPALAELARAVRGRHHRIRERAGRQPGAPGAAHLRRAGRRLRVDRAGPHRREALLRRLRRAVRRAAGAARGSIAAMPTSTRMPRCAAARHPEDRAHGLRRQGPGRACATREEVRAAFDAGRRALPAGKDAAAGLRSVGADRARRRRRVGRSTRSRRTCTRRHPVHDHRARPERVGRLRVAQAQERRCAIVAELGYVGVLCIEFFVLEDGSLVVNEMAPRPHNSGHYTIDACVTSQFAQQVRAMAGCRWATCASIRRRSMLNILGDVWFDGERRSARAGVGRGAGAARRHLHLYGKEEARRGRKMGHVTFVAPTLEEAQRQLRAACADPADSGMTACDAGRWTRRAIAARRARCSSGRAGRVSDRDRVRPRRRRREPGSGRRASTRPRAGRRIIR